MTKWHQSESTMPYMILFLFFLPAITLFVLGNFFGSGPTFWQGVSSFAAVMLGFWFSYLVMVIHGRQTRPHLQIRPFPALKAAGSEGRGKLLECLLVNVEHKRSIWPWVMRQKAYECHGIIAFRHAEDHPLALHRIPGCGLIIFWDSPGKGKQDLAPGHSLEIDIAHKYVGESQYYLGNHHYKLETESEPNGDLDKWPVPQGNYLVEIIVYESTVGLLTRDLVRLQAWQDVFQLEKISCWKKIFLKAKITSIERGEREAGELFRVMGCHPQTQTMKRVRRFFLYSGNVHQVINQSQWGMTPLSYACWLSNVELASLLIWRGADLNPGQRNWTPLLAACLKGNSDLVELLLSKGADVNLPGYSNWTPLMIAVKQDHEKIVEILLEAGADVSAVNEYGQRARHYSNSERISVILDSADPDSRDP